MALGGTFSQMVSLSILGVLHYVKNDVPLIMSHLVPVPPRPSKKWGLCPTNSGFVHTSSLASLEVMRMVAYLRKQEIGEVNFLIGRCRVGPTRNMTAN